MLKTLKYVRLWLFKSIDNRYTIAEEDPPPRWCDAGCLGGGGGVFSQPLQMEPNGSCNQLSSSKPRNSELRSQTKFSGVPACPFLSFTV